MRALTLVDQLFLILDNEKQPMQVGGLFLFELPKGKAHDFEAFITQMQGSNTPPTFPFNQVLHNLTFWKTVNQLDINKHFFEVNLADDNGLPASKLALFDYVATEQGRAMDKSLPLWQCHVISGFTTTECDVANQATHGDTPTQIALYLKVHHAMLDGIAAMRLVQRYLSPSPNDTTDLPIWSRMSYHQHSADDHLSDKPSAYEVMKSQLGAVKPVFNALKQEFTLPDSDIYVSSTQAPPSILNQRISHSRQFTAQSYDITEFKQLAEVLDVSINDIALALCAGALRRYLLAVNELPDDPLIAGVPTSLRKDGSASGNQLAFVLCNLATHLADPMHRLTTIHQSVKKGRQRFGNMNQIEFINYSMLAYAWEGVNLLTKVYPKKQLFNIAISNIKGDTQPLYWNGAKLTALYPASIILDGLAMNITLVSYAEHIEFGIIACQEALPDINLLVSHIDEELAILKRISHRKHTNTAVD